MTAAAKKESPAEEAVPEAPKNPLILKLKLYWSPPKESFFARILILLCVFTVASMGVATHLFLKIQHQNNPVAHLAVEDEDQEDEGEEEEPHAVAESGEHGEAKEGAEEAVLGGPKISKSILARRDGILEEGHDLVEPELESTRSISSLLKNELKVDFGARYVELPEIFTSLREGMIYDGKLILNVALEVNSTEAKVEIEKRSTEIRSLISAVASERQKQSMMTTQGILSFKEEIYREIGLLVGAGKVSDVLITNYNVR